MSMNTLCGKKKSSICSGKEISYLVSIEENTTNHLKFLPLGLPTMI